MAVSTTKVWLDLSTEVRDKGRFDVRKWLSVLQHIAAGLRSAAITAPCQIQTQGK